MPTILEKRLEVEGYVPVAYVGKGAVSASWDPLYADDPRHDCQYTKMWGTRCILYIRGFVQQPVPKMDVFEIRLYNEPSDLGYASYQIGGSNGFFSSANGIDKLLDGIESRPLKNDEINEFYKIFTEQLCDLGGRSPVLRFLRSKTNLVWRKDAIKSALEQMKDEALRMNGQDRKRYKRKLQECFASKLVSEKPF